MMRQESANAKKMSLDRNVTSARQATLIWMLGTWMGASYVFAMDMESRVRQGQGTKRLSS